MMMDLNEMNQNNENNGIINDIIDISNNINQYPIRNLNREFELLAAQGLLDLSGGFFGALPSTGVPLNNIGRPWVVHSQIFCLETAEELAEHVECGICLDSEVKVLTMVETNCNHSFCYGCITRHMDSEKFAHRAPDCPMCRSKITILTTKDVEILADLEVRYQGEGDTGDDHTEEASFEDFGLDISLFDSINAQDIFVLRSADRRVLHI